MIKKLIISSLVAMSIIGMVPVAAYCMERRFI